MSVFYIRFQRGRPVEVRKERPPAETRQDWNPINGWQVNRDPTSFEQAESWARYLTAMTGKAYVGTDEGDGTWPRYRVIEAPMIGDKVSRSFNGDTYPEGEITAITKAGQVTTSTGAKFRRRGTTSGWREVGGSFWLCGGHQYEQNPHF
jgi:hypothetical protein